jgi:Patatin-like phospholipase
MPRLEKKPLVPNDPESTMLPDEIADYQDDPQEIIAVERAHYLQKRRLNNELPPPTDDNISGLCISGGGVRAATLGLGMLQAMARARKLHFFDYLSTVSGGGYIGACMTSLLSKEPYWSDKSHKIVNENHRFDGRQTGVQPENFPFLPVNQAHAPDSNVLPELEGARLGTRQQLAHLRQHGEYLTPSKGILSWDVKRAIGGIFGGVFFNVIILCLLISTVVLLHHVLLNTISGGTIMRDIRHPELAINRDLFYADSIQRLSKPNLPLFEPVKCLDSIPQGDWNKLTATEKVGVWWERRMGLQWQMIINSAISQWGLMLIFFALGVLIATILLLWSRVLPLKIHEHERDERTYKKGMIHAADRTGGQTIEWSVSWKFRAMAYFLNYTAPPLFSYGVVIALRFSGYWTDYHYLVMLALPFAYALGLFAATNLLIALYFVNQAPERVNGRWYRNFYHGLQGNVFLGLITAIIFPTVILLLFGKHSMLLNLTFSLVPVATAYFFTIQSLAGKRGQESIFAEIAKKVQTPLLNLSVFLVIGIAFAAISNLVYSSEGMLKILMQCSRSEVTWLLFAIVSLSTLILGFAVNYNDISLHYFYRDRLSEAYLRTNGSVQRPEECRTHFHGPIETNFRDHEALKLSEIGEGNNRGPYHIILAALNLQGSHDVNQRNLKSDHYMFSKYFVGSRTTGFYRTDHYNFGVTRLATAMAVSAAAVSSGMGALGFVASNFYMTLLNLRTGYWMRNPFMEYRDALTLASSNGWAKFRMKLARRFPFWLRYLGSEMTGELSGTSRLVYISDGGHTGDNLGLLPLIERKCKMILIADFEEDHLFTFGSFSQAVRLAKARFDAEIHIDLQPIMPSTEDDSKGISKKSVAKGYVEYADGSRGTIVYMKSAINLLEVPEEGAETVVSAPVFVLNYHKTNPLFPHQSTSDQYFDEVQFEAYRMLGEHIGTQAAQVISFEGLSK